MSLILSPRRLLHAVVALLVASLSGCIPFVPVYYAYPAVSYVPSVKVEAADEVHVFRVDIADDLSCPEFHRPNNYRYRLTRMHIWPGNRT
jgi:hypothetical protein